MVNMGLLELRCLEAVAVADGVAFARTLNP